MRSPLAILCWGAIIEPKPENNKVSVVRFSYNQKVEERPTTDALRHLRVCGRCRHANEITEKDVEDMFRELEASQESVDEKLTELTERLKEIAIIRGRARQIREILEDFVPYLIANLATMDEKLAAETEWTFKRVKKLLETIEDWRV